MAVVTVTGVLIAQERWEKALHCLNALRQRTTVLRHFSCSDSQTATSSHQASHKPRHTTLKTWAKAREEGKRLVKDSIRQRGLKKGSRATTLVVEGRGQREPDCGHRQWEPTGLVVRSDRQYSATKRARGVVGGAAGGGEPDWGVWDSRPCPQPYLSQPRTLEGRQETWEERRASRQGDSWGLGWGKGACQGGGG